MGDDKNKDKSKEKGNEKDNRKEIINAKLVYLRELIDYYRCIQASMIRKVQIQKKILCLFCDLLDELKVKCDEDFDKDKASQLIRLLSISIQYLKIVDVDIIAQEETTLKINEIICRIEIYLKICKC